jgi:thiol:disulfide interchange protein DsbA
MTRLRRLLSSLSLLLLLASVPAGLAWSAPPVEEGRHYALLEGGTPWQTAKPGRIEVAEVFAYWCGHCARLAPLLETWKARQARDVQLVYLPLPSGRDDAFARGFFAVQAAGATGKVHARLFEAVHQAHTVPKNPSIEELAAWYAQQGLDGKRLASAMQAPELADRLAAARQFAIRSGVEGTPTLIVDGRYRILGDSMAELLRNTDAVIAHVRANRRR